MGAFKGGLEEAAKMLSGLSPKQRSKVFSLIVQKDPEMAEALKKNMVVFEDLKFLSQKMLIELLREIDLKDLSLALKSSSEELRKLFLGNDSKAIKREILDVLNGKLVPLSKAQEAQEKVMEVVREKVDRGELILKESGDEYV